MTHSSPTRRASGLECPDEAGRRRHCHLGRPSDHWSEGKCACRTAWHGSCQTRRSFVPGLSRGVGTDYHSQMTLSITSAFDAGNIRVLDITGHRADLDIVMDQHSDFHQWLSFRLTGAGGAEVAHSILDFWGAA